MITKKRVFMIPIILATLFSNAISFNDNEATHYVHFDNGFGEVVTYEVNHNTKIDLPNITNIDYHSLSTWISEDTNHKYQVSQTYTVTKDILFRASYDLDYVAIVNKMSQDIVKSNVTIHNVIKNSEGATKTYLGSGSIFYEKNDYYYVVTNEHVIANEPNCTQQINVMDYLSSGSVIASKVGENPLYDLGVIKFRKVIDLPLLPFASGNPKIKDVVFAFGQPLGQLNTITTGRVTGYRRPANQNGIEVDFSCLMHTAPSNHGSSGCMILNSRLQLVAVHFAGSRSSEDEFIYGLAIPIEKVVEFVTPLIDNE